MSQADPAVKHRIIGAASDDEAMNERPPLANIVTLGVSDIAGERDFYGRLGWPMVLDTDDFVVFELRGALLALFGAEDLGRDAHAAPERGAGGIRSSIIITVDQPEDVDALTERARAAGARVTKEPVAADFFEGRDAYFADPEGNFWEVAWSADNLVTAAARRAAGQ
ncbi:MAG TPA: VOC family protein [Microlunatus sp.]|nr:VOC family protein [Microlunatus sp.]